MCAGCRRATASSSAATSLGGRWGELGVLGALRPQPGSLAAGPCSLNVRGRISSLSAPPPLALHPPTHSLVCSLQAASATTAARDSTFTAASPTRVRRLQGAARAVWGCCGACCRDPGLPPRRQANNAGVASAAGPEQDLLFGHHNAGLFGYSHLCGEAPPSAAAARRCCLLAVAAAPAATVTLWPAQSPPAAAPLFPLAKVAIQAGRRSTCESHWVSPAGQRCDCGIICMRAPTCQRRWRCLSTPALACRGPAAQLTRRA